MPGVRLGGESARVHGRDGGRPGGDPRAGLRRPNRRGRANIFLRNEIARQRGEHDRTSLTRWRCFSMTPNADRSQALKSSRTLNTLPYLLRHLRQCFMLFSSPCANRLEVILCIFRQHVNFGQRDAVGAKAAPVTFFD